jgi:hypothetical protein
VVYRELRVSSVKSGAMQAWLSEWREHIKPLRVRLGFAIPAAWVVECEDRFVWLLEYDGDDFEAANAAYYDSSERQALDPDPARHLSATEHLPLQSVFSTRDANTRVPAAWPHTAHCAEPPAEREPLRGVQPAGAVRHDLPSVLPN